jgi:hypothetical protein
MDTFNGQVSTRRVLDILGNARAKGVSLWCEKGQLRYRAPKGALSVDEIERLRAYRDLIASFLETTSSSTTRIEPRSPLDRVPLTFSQIAHWHLYRLGERPSSGTGSFIGRLRGQLDLEALNKSVAAVVRCHESLRARIAVCDGNLVQLFAPATDYEMRVEDLTGLPASAIEDEISRLIDEYVLCPIDVKADPLFRVHLLRVHDHESVLIVIMEHLISDGFSLDVLLGDLFAAYAQAIQGREPLLPPVPIQFADYAVWQKKAHAAWIERHGPYWQRRLEGCQRLRIRAIDAFDDSQCGLGNVPFVIDAALTADLRDWARRKGTTLVMSVLTAYVALVLRWCNASEAVFPCETDGRFSTEMQRTIGYFAFPLYLRIALFEKDTFIDLLNRVTEEYCHAYEHADFSYMESQVPRPGFTRNMLFNWVGHRFNAGDSRMEPSEHGLTCSPILITKRMLSHLDRDAEPHVAFLEGDHEIRANVQFSLERFSFHSAEKLGCDLLLFLRALVNESEAPIQDVALP